MRQVEAHQFVVRTIQSGECGEILDACEVVDSLSAYFDGLHVENLVWRQHSVLTIVLLRNPSAELGIGEVVLVYH